MMKLKAAMVGCVLMISMSAMGSIYDYSATGPLSLTDGSWSLEQSGDFFGVLYSSTLDDKQLQFNNVYGGEGYANRGAYVWTAPEGEVITKVGFYWWRAGYLAQFNPALFSVAEDGTLADAEILWSTESQYNNYADGLISYSIDAAKKVTSIGLGFDDTWSDAGHTALFNTVIVETAAVPEPISLVMLGLGGLALIRRK